MNQWYYDVRQGHGLPLVEGFKVLTRRCVASPDNLAVEYVRAARPAQVRSDRLTRALVKLDPASLQLCESFTEKSGITRLLNRSPPLSLAKQRLPTLLRPLRASALIPSLLDRPAVDKTVCVTARLPDHHRIPAIVRHRFRGARPRNVTRRLRPTCRGLDHHGCPRRSAWNSPRVAHH